MPVYSYKCNDCGADSDIKATVEEKAADKPDQFLCSACGSTNIKQEFSLTALLNKAGQPSGPYCDFNPVQRKKGSSGESGCASGGGCCA